jgi:hypothetical protein
MTIKSRKPQRVAVKQFGTRFPIEIQKAKRLAASTISIRQALNC